MKKIICLLTALCALFLISAVAESGFALDPKRINEAAESVVILEQKDEEGNVIARASGFAALEPGLVITSASFIEDAGEIIAISDAGETLSVSGSMLVKLFTREKKEYDKFVSVNKEVTDYSVKEARSGRLFFVLMGMLRIPVLLVRKLFHHL